MEGELYWMDEMTSCRAFGAYNPHHTLKGESMRRLLLLAIIVTLGLVAAAQSRQPAGTAHTGKAFRFNKVVEGVYHAVGTGALTVVGNSSFIVNDDDVIVVTIMCRRGRRGCCSTRQKRSRTSR